MLMIPCDAYAAVGSLSGLVELGVIVSCDMALRMKQ